MKRQDMLDTMVQHLYKMRKPCRGEITSGIDKGSDKCKYRHNGRKCAVGALIPDHMYKKEFEGLSVGVLMDNFKEIRTLLGVRNKEFLGIVQSRHDIFLRFDKGYLDYLYLKDIAHKFNLNTKVLDETYKAEKKGWV